MNVLRTPATGGESPEPGGSGDFRSKFRQDLAQRLL
jgi:hypothetical protein